MDSYAKIQLAYKASSWFTSNNPILLAGQKGIESDTNLEKTGDGVTNWINLPYSKIRVNDIIGTTDQLSEGVSNLYYTEARINSKLNSSFKTINNISILGSGNITITTTNNNRLVTLQSSATPTINVDLCDIVNIDNLDVDITNFNVTGTPYAEQCLIINIISTANRNISWGNLFESTTVGLPTNTVANEKITIGFMYNSTSSKWRCVGVS